MSYSPTITNPLHNSLTSSSKYKQNDRVSVENENSEIQPAKIKNVHRIVSGDKEEYTYDITYDSDPNAGVISNVKESLIRNITEDSNVSNSIDTKIIKSITETVNRNGTKTTCITTDIPLRGGLKSRKPKKKVAKKRSSQKKRKGGKRKSGKSA